MVRVGIIGAGFTGLMHAETYKQFPDVKIVGIADTKGEKAKHLAEKVGAIPFYSTDTLLNRKDITIINVCIPTYLHKDCIIKAAELGKDVICEAPIALNTSDSEEIIKKCKEKRVRLIIAHSMRFWPEYKFLKDIYDAGRLGKLLSITLSKLSTIPIPVDNWVLNNEYSGGIIIDLHIHDTDFLLYLIGQKPEKIYTTGRKTESGYHHIYTIYKFPGEIIASAECGWDFPGNYTPVTAYTAVFEKAVVEYNTNNKPTVTVYYSDGKTDRPLIETKNVQTAEGNTINLAGYFYELKYFIEHIVDNKSFQIIQPEDALNSLRVVLKEKESADTGKEISV